MSTPVLSKNFRHFVPKGSLFPLRFPSFSKISFSKGYSLYEDSEGHLDPLYDTRVHGPVGGRNTLGTKG